MGLYKSKKKQIKELKDALRIEKRFFSLALNTAQQLERLNKRLISENNLFREMEAFDASLKRKLKESKIEGSGYPNTGVKGAKVTTWTKKPSNFETPWIN